MRFDVSSVLTGTAVLAVMAIAQPQMTFAAVSGREVAKVAVPTTVRIDNPLSPKDGGSGVIIAKNGNTYTVLTAAHVVKNPNVDYGIYTSKKKTYKVTNVKVLQKSTEDPDLATITFESPEEQAVAPVTNSDEASIGSGVYISGFAQSAEDPNVREYEFTSGQVSSRRDRAKDGYTLRYDAVTRRGMSGGPVFDVSGRVVGIHGRGDRDAVVRNESAASGSTTEIKTGFNAAIPINTFMSVAPQSGVTASAITVDEKPPENVPAVKPSKEELRSWEGEFAAAVGIQILRNIGVPIPSIPGFGGFGF